MAESDPTSAVQRFRNAPTTSAGAKALAAKDMRGHHPFYLFSILKKGASIQARGTVLA
jgi:hypothetical protein